MIVVIKMSHFARAHKCILTTGRKAEQQQNRTDKKKYNLRKYLKVLVSKIEN